MFPSVTAAHDQPRPFCPLQELREHGEKKKRSREDAGDNDDTEGAIGVRNKVAGGKMKKRKGR